MLASPLLGELTKALEALGMSPSSASDLSSHVQANSWPIDGALSRCSQAKHGIDKGVLPRADVLKILCQQPAYLECCHHTVYEDSDIVAVNKAFDTQLHRDNSADGWEREITLRDHLAAHHAEVLTPSGDMRLCHQLDFATSGLIVAAKSHDSASAVARTFRERDARKLYCALCFGHPSFDVARWEDRIMVSKRRFKQRISSAPRSKTARTDVTVGARGILKLGDDHRGRECAMLWLEPRTGRRHQLRLHAAHAGHALVGDFTYAGDKMCYRTFLHASALELPLSDENTLRIKAPVAPSGWMNAFEPLEELKSPDGWPNAVESIVTVAS